MSKILDNLIEAEQYQSISDIIKPQINNGYDLQLLLNVCSEICEQYRAQLESITDYNRIDELKYLSHELCELYGNVENE